MTKRVYFSVMVACVLAAAGCDPGDSEARGRMKELEASNAKLEQRVKDLETQRSALEEQSRRLQAQLAAATGGKGIELEDRQRAADDRKAVLDSLASRLTGREAAIAQTEVKLKREAQEFYERTNMTMEEIGSARQLKQEYEIMRADKNSAQAKAEQWLKFIWGVSIALAATIIACVILAYRSWSQHRAADRELVYRQQMAQILQQTISAHLDPERSITAMNALRALAPPLKQAKQVQAEAAAT